MKISVFGLGYVGTVTAACLADLGHSVVGVDIVSEKADAIGRGKAPIKEPGIEKLVARARRRGLLRATTSTDEAVGPTELAIICVGTPGSPDGGVDTTHVSRVLGDIVDNAGVAGGKLRHIVNRSTCPPDVHRSLHEVVCRRTKGQIAYLAHPEFLREGSAVDDFADPPFCVFGSTGDPDPVLCSRLYPGMTAPEVWLSLEEAALVKYASNAYHALKVTFANEIGQLCREFGADALKVMEAFCLDHSLNISDKYLRPGLPFGGSCLPKDVAAVVHQANVAGICLPVVSAILRSNDAQLASLETAFGGGRYGKIALLGLAFKTSTDDVRNSPLVRLARRLIDSGVEVTAWDPYLRLDEVIGASRAYLFETLPEIERILVDDAETAIRKADAIIIGQALDHHLLASLSISPTQTVFDLGGVVARDALPAP